MVEEIKTEETKVEETKSTLVKAAPRHAVKKILMMKNKSFEDIQIKKQIDSIKLWSDKVINESLKSERSPAYFKEACELELKMRNERRLKK